MDPTLTLALMLESLKERDSESAHAYLSHLTEWMDKGGFVPSVIDAMLAAIQRARVA
jgi:hypothetical protein